MQIHYLSTLGDSFRQIYIIVSHPRGLDKVKGQSSSPLFSYQCSIHDSKMSDYTCNLWGHFTFTHLTLPLRFSCINHELRRGGVLTYS